MDLELEKRLDRIEEKLDEVIYDELCTDTTFTPMNDWQIKVCDQMEHINDVGDLSDGFHTFNSLYNQRAILFASLIDAYPEISWKSKKHADGHYCFDKGGDWFIVGIDTPEGQYTYHFETALYWHTFDCKELEKAPEWDGHTDDNVGRLRSLRIYKNRKLYYGHARTMSKLKENDNR